MKPFKVHETTTPRKRKGRRSPGALKGKIRLERGWRQPLTKRERALWEIAAILPEE